MVQTASGNSGAEMTLEGLQEFEAVRDFLYSKMRGVKDHPPLAAAAGTGAPAGRPSPAADAELAATLREITHELRALREELARRPRT